MYSCEIWQGPTCSNGRYGRVLGPTDEFMAHRKAYSDEYGPIPEGMVVCHTCDNGLCVNPKHLFLGTQSDNMKDAFSKKRIPHLNKSQIGADNHNAKYTKEFAEQIRDYYQTHQPTFSALAKQFNLKSKGHAHAIVTKKIWIK